MDNTIKIHTKPVQAKKHNKEKKIMFKGSTPVMAVLVLALGLAACAPQATPEPTAVPPTEMPTEVPMSKDIVDVAAADGRFTILVAAAQAAGLVDALKGEGPLTVFAPTDDAFAKLPDGTVEELLKPENKQALTDILLYHVVDGKVMAADVVELTSATTLLGKDISITVKDGKVFLNDTIEVIITDIEASNGVIHVIDAVLIPPQ